MIIEAFRRTQRPLNELIIQTLGELGKHYSRLELAYARLNKRNNDLFNACSYYIRNGSKARATIYANEIAEIRKILSVLQHTQLSLERAMLRLETFKAVSPTFDELKGIFGDVKKTLGMLGNIMPSVTPEIEKLNSAISEVLGDTQFNLSPPEPIVIKDAGTEAILEEAAKLVEQELQSRIPEPPLETSVPKPAEPVKPSKPMIAVAAEGSEVYLDKSDAAIENRDSSSVHHEFPISLSEELVLDYIERNNGEVNVTKCAEELDMPTSEIFEILESLSKKGKIRIEQ